MEKAPTTLCADTICLWEKSLYNVLKQDDEHNICLFGVKRIICVFTDGALLGVGAGVMHLRSLNVPYPSCQG